MWKLRHKRTLTVTSSLLKTMNDDEDDGDYKWWMMNDEWWKTNKIMMMVMMMMMRTGEWWWWWRRRRWRWRWWRWWWWWWWRRRRWWWMVGHDEWWMVGHDEWMKMATVMKMMMMMLTMVMMMTMTMFVMTRMMMMMTMMMMRRRMRMTMRMKMMVMMTIRWRGRGRWRRWWRVLAMSQKGSTPEAGPAFATGKAAACHLDIGWGNTRGAAAGWQVHFHPWCIDVLYVVIFYIRYGRVIARSPFDKAWRFKTMNLIRTDCFSGILDSFGCSMNVEWKSHGFLHPCLSDLLAPWIKESWDSDGVKLYREEPWRAFAIQRPLLILRRSMNHRQRSEHAVLHQWLSAWEFMWCFSDFIIGAPRSQMTSRNFLILSWS